MRQPAQEVEQLREHGLLRQLRPIGSPAGPRIEREGRELWNFASNDYLGLACHESIRQALAEGVEQFGAGSAASRLICGSQSPHMKLEEALAEAKQSEAALSFSSGFATAMGSIPAIVGKGDFVILDKLCHACLVDAAKLSEATLRVFAHNDLGKLEKLLRTIRGKDAGARILVACESVYSMDGDLCPLREIVELTEAHDALLLVDEAHGFGVLGEHGMGLAQREGLQERITFQMGTLSKAAGLSGGYLTASRDWIDLLINRARSFIYSTAPPPCIAYAGLHSLNLIRSQTGRELRSRLHDNIASLGCGSTTPIVPVVIGDNETALSVSAELENAGLLIPAIRYPTVPRGTARLRISISAAHSSEAIDDCKQALSKLKN